MRHAHGSHLMLLHGFQKGGLRLGRRSVDFIGQDHVGKDRTLDKDHLAIAVHLFQDLRAGDVCRHEVRRELDAAKTQVKQLRQSMHQQRLGQARCAGEQTMSP